MKKLLLLLPLLAFNNAAAESAATTADAALHSLDPVVVTGSRVAHPSMALPFSVDVVEGRRLGDAQPGVNLSEELAAVPGILVQNRQNYAQDLQVSSRGFGARSTFGIRGLREYADGIPVSMPDGQGQAATLNLDLADRIEVLRGPFSVMYGNHSGGVIQLQTRAAANRPAVEYAVDAGSHGSWKSGLTAEGRQGRTEYLFNISRFDTNGYRQHSAATRDQLFTKLGVGLTGKGKLTFIANGLRQEDSEDPLGLDWDSYRTDRRSVAPAALAYDTRKSISHLQGGASYEQRFGSSELHLTAFSGKRRVVQYQAIPVAAQASPSSSGGVIDFDRRFGGVNGRWSTARMVGTHELITSAGVDYERMRDDRLGFENFDGGRLGVKGALRRAEDDTVSSAGAYLQAELQGERWGVHGGLRHSRVKFSVDDAYLANGDDSGGKTYRHTSPSAGIVYRQSEHAVWYASAARGFETPTLNEMFYSGAGGGFNFGLDPSISKHLELGFKGRLREATSINIAVFGIRTRDELVVDVARGGRTSYRNASRTERSGIEIAGEHRWSGNLQSRLAFTALDARYAGGGPSDGKRLPGIPKLSLFADLVWENRAAGLRTGMEMIASGKAEVEDRNDARPAPGYAIFNARLSAEQTMGAWRFREYVRINNLLDRAYIGSVIVNEGNRRYYEPAPGRNWMLGISAKYDF